MKAGAKMRNLDIDIDIDISHRISSLSMLHFVTLIFILRYIIIVLSNAHQIEYRQQMSPAYFFQDMHAIHVKCLKYKHDAAPKKSNIIIANTSATLRDEEQMVTK